MDRSVLRWSKAVLGAVALALLLVVSLPGVPAFAFLRAPSVPAVPGVAGGSSLPLATVTDGANASAVGPVGPLSIADAIVPGTDSLNSRSYAVVLSTPTPATQSLLKVYTTPVTQWSFPGQLPGGADALPPLINWTWTVYRGTANDTANWTSAANGTLSRTVPWANASYVVSGQVHLGVAIHVYPLQADGTHAAGGSLMMINPGSTGAIPWNDPDFANLLTPLHPYIVRIGQIAVAPATWNNATHSASFNLAPLGQIYNLTHKMGAKLYLSVSVGTWGDGNSLPAGMPLNTSNLVTFGPLTGYFPTSAAYTTYITALATAVKLSGYTVDYWNIGNEVPVKNGSTVYVPYAQLYNAAASAIHTVLPTAKVGSDILTVPIAISYLASTLKGVDYLSYHFYPSVMVCPVPGVYCVPHDSNGYWRDGSLWGLNHTVYGSHFDAPRLAQLIWHNATGRWIPILDSESNLAKQGQVGTDPRQQQLYGAAWTISSLIDGSQQNVSAYIYYSLEGDPTVNTTMPSGRYGGWGWGMTSEGTVDNDTLYAPYYAMQMWDNGFPAGAAGVRVASSNPAGMPAYAVRVGNFVSLIVTNRYDVATQVQLLNLKGAPKAPMSVQILDSGTYSEVFNAQNQTEQLVLSSAANYTITPGTRTLNLTLQGYGVAFVRFDPSNATNSTSGNSTGNTTGNSTGSGGGTVTIPPTNLTGGTPGSNSSAPGSHPRSPGSPPASSSGAPSVGGLAAQFVALARTDGFWGAALLTAIALCVAAGWRGGRNDYRRSGARPRRTPRARLG